MRKRIIWWAGALAVLALAWFGVSQLAARMAQSAVRQLAADDGGGTAYQIVSLLPKDAIRAIDNPRFVEGAEADEQYSEDEVVLGVEINGDLRAYSVPFLSGHEIVNDVVGGEPIAVTW